MAKVFLTCFSPFHPKERPFSPHSASPLKKNERESFPSLIHDLGVLTSSLENESISLKWCSEALFLIKSMHSDFLVLFSQKVSQVASSGSWDRVEMVEEYLKESLDLLDLCNLLKSAISGFHRELDIQKWKEKSLSKIMTAKASTIPRVIAMVSFMVFCSVLNPTPITIDLVFTKSGHHDSFSGPVKRLVACFLERFRAGNGCAVGVGKEGLELLSAVVDEVFDDVIQGRNKVIGWIGL